MKDTEYFPRGEIVEFDDFENRKQKDYHRGQIRDQWAHSTDPACCRSLKFNEMNEFEVE